MLPHLLQRIYSPKATIARLKWYNIAKSQALRMASTFPDLPIFRAIASHDPKSTAVIHSKSDRRFTYGELLKDVEGAKIKLYHQLKAAAPDDSVGGQRVAFLIENGYDYVGAVNASGCFTIQNLTKCSDTALDLCLRQYCHSAICWLSRRRVKVHRGQ